jgi:hypothetical protein
MKDDPEARPMHENSTVYVYLLGASVDVWRPVAAEKVGPNLFRLSGPVPDGESWQFQPGEVVYCEERALSGGPAVVALKMR